MSTLRAALLPFTLQNAVRLEFYREFWRGIDVEAITTIRELTYLPTLSKEQYRQSLMWNEEAVRDTEFITHSTGTTGQLTWRHRSAAEAAIINELFGGAAHDAPTELALVMRYNRHGMSMPIPGRTRSIPIGLDDDDELEQCLDMLTASYHFAGTTYRPTIITGSGHDVAIVIQAWLESQKNADTVGYINAVYVMGYVDAGLRRFLHDSLGTPVLVEKYSLSEIMGGASRTWPESSFVLEPHVVGEVVDEAGAQVPVGGVGELVLTELFPFVQMQPMIRYRTGDVVRLVGNTEDTVQFEWWGRRRQCVLTQVGRPKTWIFGYRPAADWLSLQPIVARETHRIGLSHVRSGDIGLPCVIVQTANDGETVEVDIGLRVNPWWERANVQRMVNEFWTAMRSTLVVPAESVRLQLSVRHMSQPACQSETWMKAPAMQTAPSLLSREPPTLP